MKHQIFEEGYHAIQDILEKERVQKIFVACGNRIDIKFVNYLNSLNVKYILFDEITPNPVYEDIVKGLRLFKEHDCDFIISIGGGSVIDAAKTIKLFSEMNEDEFFLDQEFIETKVKHLTIPTTAGTGSESTRFSVIYYNDEKQSLAHEDIIPEYVIFESVVLKTLPEYQKKATMLDALCQAIESYWSVNSNEESKEYAKKALELILENMQGYLQNKEEAFRDMLIASNFSGRAINITQTTAPHAMSYKLTTLYGVSHGHSVALCLPHVWRYMAEMLENEQGASKIIDPRGAKYLKDTLLELSNIFGCDSNEEAIQRFEAFYKSLCLSNPYINEKAELEILAKSVNPIRLKNSPIYLDQETIEILYKEILEKKLEIGSMFR